MPDYGSPRTGACGRGRGSTTTAAADVYSEFDDFAGSERSDDVDDPAAVAAANAGRRLAPAPTSARAIAAANAAGVVRATAPGQSWAPR